MIIAVVVAVAFLMEQLDATIVVTALPTMARSLATTPVALNIVITSYVLSLAMFIPVSGWFADRLGARRVFAAAIVVFTASSMLCGLSTSLAMLVVMRVFQGIGGAMMIPVGRLILLQSYPKAELATAMSYMTLPVLVGPVAGPVLGGFIATYASWRWIFFINIPIGIAGLVAALLLLPRAPAKPGVKFDLVGFMIAGIGLLLVQLALEMVGRHDPPPLSVATIAAVAVLMLTTYWSYSRGRPHAVLDLGLLRIRAFRVGSVAGGLCRIGMNAVPFLLPLLLQLNFGYSAMQSGLLTFVSALGALSMKPVNNWLLRRFGFDRVLLGNAALAAFIVAGFALFRAGIPTPVMLAYIFVFGMVRTIQFTTSNALSFADIPEDRLSRCVSLAGVLQQLTVSFGVSLSAMVLTVLAPGRAPTLADFHVAFLLMAALPLLAIPAFLTLRAEDGAAVSRHVRRAA